MHRDCSRRLALASAEQSSIMSRVKEEERGKSNPFNFFVIWNVEVHTHNKLHNAPLAHDPCHSMMLNVVHVEPRCPQNVTVEIELLGSALMVVADAFKFLIACCMSKKLKRRKDFC